LPQPIPEVLRGAANEAVFAHLRDLSAHSDVTAALEGAVAPLGDVRTFCPDPSRYKYVAFATRGVVFAFAAGMNSVGLRLSPEIKARAVATGAADLPHAGPEWVSITLFRDDWPEPDLGFWARKAYVFARGQG
jgi:hypothetical protein